MIRGAVVVVLAALAAGWVAYVHVWRDGEQIYRNGRADPHYVSDPESMHALQQLASIAGSAPKRLASSP